MFFLSFDKAIYNRIRYWHFFSVTNDAWDSNFCLKRVQNIFGKNHRETLIVRKKIKSKNHNIFLTTQQNASSSSPMPRQKIPTFFPSLLLKKIKKSIFHLLNFQFIFIFTAWLFSHVERIILYWADWGVCWRK